MNPSGQDNVLGTANVKTLLRQLAIPAITAQVVNVLYNVVDRMYIGHIPDIGALALTGVGVCMPIIMLITAFAALVSMGSAPRASVLMGRGDNEEAHYTLGNSFIMLIIIALILTVFFRRFAEPLLMAFGASENTIGYAMDYMRIYTLGTIFVQFALGLNAFITAQGFAKISMATVVIGAIINIVLDPIFIFGFHMGVKGAALATIISQAVSAIWVLRFLTGKKTILKLQKKYFRLRGSVVGPCLLLGMSPFIMQATESAISTGYNFGAGNADRVRQTFRLLLRYCLTYSLILWAICMAVPRLIPSMFTGDEQLLTYTAWALRHYMALSGIFGIQIACQQTFIAIGNAKTSLFLAVYRKIILLIPLIYILPAILEQKDRAVFLAEPVADFIAVTTTAIMFAYQFKNAMKKLEAGKKPAEA